MVLAAGCAGGASGGSVAAGRSSGLTTGTTSAPPPVTGPAFPGVHLPAGATPVAGSQVNATGLPSAFPRLAWLEQNGTLLGFYGQEGGCFTSSASVTQQTDTQVVVRLVQQQAGTGGHACPQFVRYKAMSVPLAKPLGSRTVVLHLAIVRG
jgi:hypothetical protein